MRWKWLRGNVFYRYDRSRGLTVAYWDGKIIIEEPLIRPYAFVNANVSWKIEDKVARVDSTDLVTIKGVPVDRFEVDNPKVIARIRDKHAGYWKTHEADILFVRRLMIDGVLEPKYGAVQESVVYWDIEVNDEKGFPEPGDPLVSLAYSLGGGKVKFLHVSWFDSPEQLVEEFMKDTVYRGYTVFSAWNVSFDMEYFGKWFEWLETNGDLETAVKLMEPLDLLTAYRQTVKGLSSYSLGNVAFHEGMVEEAEAKKSRKAIHEMSEKELEEYNTRDVEMIVEIDKKYGFSETAISLAETVGLVVSQAYYPDEYRLVATRVADNFLIPRAREYGVVMPNASKDKKKGYEGALVLSPKVGFHRRVAYYDVESMYPNVIVHYKIDVPGFKGELLPSVMRELLERRKEYKRLFKETGDAKYDVAQKVYKILANSMYGVLGVEGSRYFDERKAATVTAKGREVLQRTILVIGELGYEVFYADTDSCFVKLNENDDPESFAEVISERISPFRIKLEGVGDVLFVAKKRYIMRTYDGEEIVRGLEIRRGDWSDFTKMVVARVVDMIFEGKGRLEIEKYLAAVRGELYRGEYDDKLIITKSIDPRRKYKVEAEHVKAWKKMGAPKTVTTVSYVFVRGGVEPVTSVADVSRFRGRLDYKRYWSLTKQAVDRLLKAVGSGGGMDVWMRANDKNKNLAGTIK